MQKISVDKKDTAPKIVQKMLETPDPEILLIIPANTVLKDSLSNFELLRREAESAGKRLSVETVDREALALARKAKLNAIHPLFKDDAGGRSMSDIVTSGNSRIEMRQAKQNGSKREKKVKETVGYAVSEEENLKTKKEEPRAFSYEEPKEESRRFSRRTKIFFIAFLVLVFGGGLAWGAGQAFGKAEVTIGFKKTSWQYAGAFSGSKVFAKADADRRTFPAEVFSQNKNGTWLFPASGKATVSQKATGRITIYNAYGAAPQSLVASTRFTTADGKIFRLDSQVTVPGASIKDGKIIPSSIEAVVTADKAGTEYNLGTSEKLTIPGFKGTPRYEGFYGVFSGSTSGGFIGEKAVAVDKDIVAGKEKATENLKNALQMAFAGNRPEGFTILDGASEIQIIKLSVSTTTDENGDFTVFGEARFRAIGFRDSDIRAILQELSQRDFPETSFRDLKLTFKNAKPNYDAGQIGFSLSVEGTLGPTFSSNDFKEKIAGHSVSEARQTILALPGLSTAKISLLPFWLSKLPSNPQRIKIVAD